jgi:hypothetical protein
MDIIQAIHDEQLIRPFLGEKLPSWHNWMVALRVLYGLPLLEEDHGLIRQCTGRDPGKLPTGFDTALFLTGRRSGKSRTAAIVGAFEAALAGHEASLSKGEEGLVAIVAPSKRQGQIVKGYVRAIFDTELLQAELEGEDSEGFHLASGTRIEVMSGDWRTIRGFTLLAAIIDESCFFGVEEESKIKSDTELIRAIKPALATVGGKLVAISSPYAKRGWSYQQWKLHFGKDSASTLVWNCPSRVMNRTLPQSVVDDALAEDLAAAKSEYLGEWRDDVGTFLSREIIERLVVPGRVMLPPSPDCDYFAFADLSGGRGDDAALAIAHRRRRKVVLDLCRRWRPPFNPYGVVSAMSRELQRYGVWRVIGDNYTADWACQAFASCQINYRKSEKPKSALYVELLPRLCSGEIELLDDEILVSQLAGLERRTRSGGKDAVDHPSGGHDDVANVVAGVADVAARRIIVGALGVGQEDDGD